MLKLIGRTEAVELEPPDSPTYSDCDQILKPPSKSIAHSDLKVHTPCYLTNHIALGSQHYRWYEVLITHLYLCDTYVQVGNFTCCLLFTRRLKELFIQAHCKLVPQF